MHLLLPNLSREASQFLLDLGHGKYDADIGKMDSALASISVFAPQFGVAKEILDGFVALNKATAPVEVVPDNEGGWVPSNNSRYDPKTGEFE